MAYKGERIEGQEKIRAHLSKVLRWPSFTSVQVERSEVLEYEHSSFNDPGSDWSRATLYDAHGQVVTSTRQEGY